MALALVLPPLPPPLPPVLMDLTLLRTRVLQRRYASWDDFKLDLGVLPFVAALHPARKTALAEATSFVRDMTAWAKEVAVQLRTQREGGERLVAAHVQKRMQGLLVEVIKRQAAAEAEAAAAAAAAEAAAASGAMAVVQEEEEEEEEEVELEAGEL